MTKPTFNQIERRSAGRRRAMDERYEIPFEKNEAANFINSWLLNNRSVVDLEKWHDLFDDLDNLDDIAEWLKSDICPACLGANLTPIYISDHRYCKDCGHSW